MPVTVVFSREKSTHTSGLGVASASWAGILQRSDSVAVCGNGAWASEIRVAARVLASKFPSYVLAPGCPPPWEIVHSDPKRLLLGGQRL